MNRDCSINYHLLQIRYKKKVCCDVTSDKMRTLDYWRAGVLQYRCESVLWSRLDYGNGTGLVAASHPKNCTRSGQRGTIFADKVGEIAGRGTSCFHQFKMNVARRGMKLDAQSVWRFNQDPGISSSNVKRQDTVRG
ncbi:hypothetical protein SETIT_3G338600v2 [Setaria italica]|uniref:Uncharacterized protein n=1 Tax=Setaria italica TaxID=4555 RepID=A0A368QLN0_SETIT|nr:hypothetical protein SETIT_3G338600v2 [Setaria italica]